MPLSQILQTFDPQEITDLEPWQLDNLSPITLQLLLLQPVPIIDFIRNLYLHIFRPSVTRLYVDLTQETPTFLKLQVEHRIGSFKERIIICQDVFDNVFRFHHTLPSVLHVLFHHVKF